MLAMICSSAHALPLFTHLSGEFDDDGPGWEKYPQIKRELKPVVADDGIFWVTKDEFFKYYQTIYVSASDMTEFLED